MNANELAKLVIRQLDFQEGWCSFCHKKVGNELQCNDHRHAEHCVIHALRKASVEPSAPVEIDASAESQDRIALRAMADAFDIGQQATSDSAIGLARAALRNNQ